MHMKARRFHFGFSTWRSADQFNKASLPAQRRHIAAVKWPNPATLIVRTCVRASTFLKAHPKKQEETTKQTNIFVNNIFQHRNGSCIFNNLVFLLYVDFFSKSNIPKKNQGSSTFHEVLINHQSIIPAVAKTRCPIQKQVFQLVLFGIDWPSKPPPVQSIICKPLVGQLVFFCQPKRYIFLVFERWPFL